MGLNDRFSSRERIFRIVGGLGLTAVGCAVFMVSKAHDPQNRAAILGIFGVLGGLTWAGQGLRGRREGGVEVEVAPVEGPPISAERTVAGILLAWLVPGMGHWIIGQRGKALLYFLTITACFLLGVLLAEGRNLSYDRDGVYFLAYMFNAGETALGWALTRDLEVTHKIPFLYLGFLYTAVACLLNLVAMMDFVAVCSRAADAGTGPRAGSTPVKSE